MSFIFAILPFVFLPITQDFFDTPKWMFLTGASALIVASWSIRAFRATISFSLSSIAQSLWFVAIASLASLLFSSTNRVEALLSLFGPATWLAFAALATLMLDDRVKRTSRTFLTASAGTLALLAVYQTIGLGKPLAETFPFLSDPLWTPVGSSLGLLAILAVVAPLTIGEITRHKRSPESVNFWLPLTSSVLILAAIILTVPKLAPRLPTSRLPLSTGWAITLETMKNPKSALFGVGPENFIQAFTAGRPLSLNTSPLWNARFPVNASFLLHVVVTLGLAGLAAFLWLLRSLLVQGWRRATPEAPDWPAALSLALSVLMLLFLPPSLAVLAVIVVIAADTEKRETTTWTISRSTALAAGILGMLFALAGMVFAGRAYYAEVLFYRAARAKAARNGTEAYNLGRQAISLTPAIARYHMEFSQTSLELAQALTLQSGQEATLSGQTRLTRDQLVQQAIREAKIGTNLLPGNVYTWEHLARLYQIIMPIAQGGDTWAIASYQKAATLDPTNPILRVGLGIVYRDQGNLDEASNQFLGSIALKQDYANGWYNLANTYRLKGDTARARDAYEQTLSLVPRDSEDYQKAEAELRLLK